MNSAMALNATRMAVRRMMINRGTNNSGNNGRQQLQARTHYTGPLGTPPMHYIPVWEKCVHFSILASAMFGYPLWVCYWSEYYVKKGKGEI